MLLRDVAGGPPWVGGIAGAAAPAEWIDDWQAALVSDSLRVDLVAAHPLTPGETLDSFSSGFLADPAVARMCGSDSMPAA